MTDVDALSSHTSANTHLWSNTQYSHNNPVLQVFDQTNVDEHYALWPADKLEYSAVGLDVG